MDSADPLQATGIPCAFAAYLVERDGQWQRVERGIPHRRERIRSVSWALARRDLLQPVRYQVERHPAPRAGRRCSLTADPTQPVAAHHRDRPQERRNE